MPLSIIKLHKLLNMNGFLVNSIYTIENQASYIDLFNIENADNFLLYIPSKYEINIDENSDLNLNIYSLNYIDEKELMAKFNEFEMDKEYNKIDKFLNNESSSLKNIEKNIQEDYDKDIILKDLSIHETENIKELYDQITRLRLCIKNIKFKVAVLHKNILACVRRDNDIDLFNISKFKGTNSRKLFIIIDLETLFADTVNAPTNISAVRHGIYKILSDNQLKHTKLLNSLMVRQHNITNHSNNIYKNKQILDLYLNHLEILLKRTLEAEKDKLEQITTTKEKRIAVTGISSFYSDIEKGKDIIQLEKDIENINEIKHEIIKDIVTIRTKQENLSLEMDKILFENIININKINYNFDQLAQL